LNPPPFTSTWPVRSCSATFFARSGRRPHATGEAVDRVVRDLDGLLHDVGGLTLEASRPMALQLDGDHVGAVSQVRLESVQRALRVLV
jgi:hypothetical protein